MGFLTADPFYCTPKRNSLIQIKDGRTARVIYNGLDGFGITFDLEEDPSSASVDAMLRDPGTHELECVGKKFRHLEG